MSRLRLVAETGVRPALLHSVECQDNTYATRYKAFVEKVQLAEKNKVFGNKDALSKAVAKYLYKLMAYKDEYEVARLYSNGDFLRQLQSQFEGNYHLEFHLAPPFMTKTDPDTGLPLKRHFPQWMLTVFGWLAHLKWLRGKPYDPFSYTDERKLEIRLLADYEALIDELIEHLTVDNYAIATELACLPEHIRGYGHIKEKHVTQITAHKTQLLQQFYSKENVVMHNMEQ